MRDPVEYTLRWPSQILADEIERLIELAAYSGPTGQWLSEVDTLLRQAFVSHIPAEDFQQVCRDMEFDPVYGDEEPF